MNLSHIHDGVPVAAKLPYLFRSEIKKQGHGVAVYRRRRLHEWHLDATARNSIQDPHERALRIAIANSENLHLCFFFLADRKSALHKQLFFKYHFRQRGSGRNHRINIRVRMAVENKQLRLGRMQETIQQFGCRAAYRNLPHRFFI